MHVSKDTISLECLVWAVYDNLLVPAKLLSLSGYESYGQVLQCLLDKAFRGLHTHCVACTSAILNTKGRMKSVIMVPQKALQTEKFLMMRM